MQHLIRFYQRWVSPLFVPSCRFLPTCSAYAREALAKHGLIRGSWLAMGRILRCHPYGACGMDPVPDVFAWSAVRGARTDDDTAPDQDLR